MDATTTRRKGLRAQFKRRKNDESKDQASRKHLKETENWQTPLQPLASNAQDSDSVSFKLLKTAHSFVPPEWTIINGELDRVQLCILGSNPPVVIRSVAIAKDLTWKAYVFGQKIPSSNPVIQVLPVTITSKASLQQAFEQNK